MSILRLLPLVIEYANGVYDLTKLDVADPSLENYVRDAVRELMLLGVSIRQTSSGSIEEFDLMGQFEDYRVTLAHIHVIIWPLK